MAMVFPWNWVSSVKNSFFCETVFSLNCNQFSLICEDFQTLSCILMQILLLLTDRLLGVATDLCYISAVNHPILMKFWWLACASAVFNDHWLSTPDALWWRLSSPVVGYWNTVLYSATKTTIQRLQRVNAAAWLVGGLGKYDHVTSVQRDTLHWLTIQ